MYVLTSSDDSDTVATNHSESPVRSNTLMGDKMKRKDESVTLSISLRTAKIEVGR